jgi:Domain of unknown function (DUF4145)
MDRSLWTRSIDAHSCPPWPCPECGAGTLALTPKTLVHEETVASAKAHADDNFDPEWIKYSFTAWAKCSNARCKQTFALAGSGGVSQEYQSDGDWDWEDYFLACYPMPDIFVIPSKCSPDIAESLRAAFSVFWSSPEACAGRIRVALEQIMNHLAVPKRKKNQNGRFSDLTLHARIDAFAGKEPLIGSQLMALKWLGNAGSHESSVSKADLLDAFEILEHALSEIIERRSDRVAQLAKKLVKKHGRA